LKPQPITTYNPSFGIYIKTKQTAYGHCDIGKYRGHNIEIYHDYESKSKLIYVSNAVRNWIKSKLFYIQDGIRKILRSEAK
jgi:hypothetical protein